MTHQAKRPYGGSQSSITSYFHPSSSPNYSLSSSSSTYTGNSPPLPANVQSNLLSVGMRVRKSVPEGYKTGTYAFNNNISPNTTKPISTSTQSSPSTASKPKTRPRAGNRELTPFCGILKVGGMAQQSWEIYNSPSSDAAMFEEDDDEDMPFLSSQGSTISNYSIDSSPSSNNHNAQKRRFFDDEDEVEVVEDGTTAMNTGSALALGDRILAVPRRKKWGGKGGDAVAIVGQENLGVSTLAMGMGMGAGSGPDGDFEEADFLVMDEDDLEMSG